MLDRKQREALAVCSLLILLGFFSAQILFLDPKNNIYCHEYEESSEDYCAADYAITALAIEASRIAHQYAEDFIALFTGILGIATWFLWLSTRRLVRSAEKTAERQLRAYVGLDTGAVMLDNQLINTMEIGGFVQLKNYGLTPAYDFTSWMRFRIQPTDEPPPYSKVGTPDSSSMLGPGASVAFNIEYRKILTADLQRIAHEKSTIYCWGRADYRDAFGEPRHFIFRTSKTGKHGTLNFSDREPSQGWPLSPDKNGYEAN
jgi:hypothetical protein